MRETPEELLIDAANNMLERDRSFAWPCTEVSTKLIAGQFIEKDEMDARVQKMIHD